MVPSGDRDYLLVPIRGGRCCLLEGAGNNDQSGLRFDLYALHPEDAAGEFENRPELAGRARNSQTFKDFFHLAVTARVT
jgi:hypothetical protein